MKILEILEATEGGTRTHMDAILTGLADDFEMHFVYSLNRYPAYTEDIKRYKQLGIICHEIPMERKVSLFKDRTAARKLGNLVSDLKPDIIHAHSSKAGYLSRKISRPSSSALVYTPHCLYFPYQHGIRKLIYKWGETHFEPKTDIYIAVSDEERDHLLCAITSEDKIKRINNGVDLPDIPSSREQEKRVLFPARAAKQKGWEFFLRTAELVHGKDPEIVFIFAGTGPNLSQLSAQVDNRKLTGSVILPGFVQNMGDEYLKASLVAVTSRWEGQPYSILEAMSYACPVAAFGIPGIGELITHGKEGFLAPPFDCHTLADHIITLVHDPDASLVMGMNGRKKIEALYSKNRFIKDMHNLYSELAEH